VQLSRALPRAALAAALLAVGPADGGAAAFSEDDPRAGTMFRWFTDSERIAVRSFLGDCALALFGGPVALHWNHERVVIPAIEAPAGSPEAIDAITTASRPISGDAYQDFAKVRNEVTASASRGPTTFDYYVSHESDYLAQMLGARWQKDLDDQLTVSLGSSWGWDAIDPVADDDTDTGAGSRTTLHVNAVATRVLTPTTMLRLGLEYNFVHGLQHNPYRNVYAGGTYVPESHPDSRQRRDAFLKLNQYLSQRSSLRFHYRFYNDSWGIASHEMGPTLSQYVTDGAAMRFQYRWYTQSAANFYSDDYVLQSGVDGYRTGDYRMAALSSHLFGVAFDLDFDALGMPIASLRPLGLWFSVERYFNSNDYSANIVESGLTYRF
jgi:hypothetical protein